MEETDLLARLRAMKSEAQKDKDRAYVAQDYHWARYYEGKVTAYAVVMGWLESQKSKS